MKAIAMLIALAALVAGCATATNGTDFNATNLPQLQRGKTTLAEATQLMGRPPSATQAGQTGALGHTWLFIKSTVVPGVVESKLKSVMLVFSTDGTFQRVLQMQGIDMSPEDRLRLFALPTVKQ